MRNIGYNFFLKERREEKNLSRKEASKQIKISSLTLYLIEKGYILVPKKKEESFISLYSLDNNFFKDDLLYPVSEKTEDDNSRLLKILKNKFFVSFLMILLLASVILIPVFNLLMNNAKENPNKYYLSQTIAIREEIFKQDLQDTTVVFNKIYKEDYPEDEFGHETTVSLFASSTDIGVYTTQINVERKDKADSFKIKLIPNRKVLRFELDFKNFTCAGDFDKDTLNIQGVYDSKSNPIENKELEENLQNIFFSKIIYYSDKTISKILDSRDIDSSFTTVNYLENINDGAKKFSSRYTSFNIGFVLSSTVCALTLSFLILIFIIFFLSKKKRKNIIVIANNCKSSSLAFTHPLKKNIQSFQIFSETFLKLLIIAFLVLFSVGIYFFTSNILSYIGIQSLGLSTLIKHTKGLTTIRVFTTSFFQLALILHVFLNLEQIIHNKGSYKKAILLFLLGIAFYIFEISIIYCGKHGINLFSLFISLFSKYLPGNIFFALGSIILIGVFLFDVPESLKNNKTKRRIYHTLSIIPVSYLVLSTFYSLAVKAYGFPPFSHFYSLLLYPRQSSVLLFVIILYYTIFFYQKSMIKKYGTKQAEIYFKGGRYNLIKNIIASLIITFIALFSQLIYSTVNRSISFALSITDKSIYLILLVIIFMLYRPHFGKRNRIVDISYGVLYAVSYSAGYLLTIVQLLFNYSFIAPIIEIIFNYL